MIDMDGTTDGELAARLGAGDVDAFTAIFRAYYAHVVSFVRRYVSSRDAAEDVAQETFMRLWEHRQGLDPARSLRAYLFTMARNRALNLREHESVVTGHAERARASYIDPGAVPVAPAADEFLLATELAQLAAERLETLSPRQREVYEMSRTDGLSPGEIGEILGISTQTVYVQLGRVVRALYPVLATWIADR